MTDEYGFDEAQWEGVALEALADLGWNPLQGKQIAPGTGERLSWDEVVIPGRALNAMRDLNPHVPVEYLRQALSDVLQPKSQDAITENHRLHEYLVKGYRGISYLDSDGVEHNPTIGLMSANPASNEYLAVSQVTVIRGDCERRFDVVLYCNGFPVAVIELKQAGKAHADVSAAHAQLQTYLREFPMAFRFTVCVVASDGLFAQYGTPFTPLNHFSPWNVDDDGAPIELGGPSQDGALGTGLENLLFGVFNLERFGQLQRDFTAFDGGADGLAKRIAKPHQYFAVAKAVGSTISAVESNGKAGVVWHTQGSGKSMEMELYVAKLFTEPKMLNPTIVVVTDRKELDGQLFETFEKSLLLGEKPEQVKSRAALREGLALRTTGGIYFTTLQKFGLADDERAAGADHPLLSDRRNIVVVVDEAHRSHYDDLDGYARHLADALPNATLIAFTGTPISFDDRNTREVFGDYIDIYDLSRAVDDGATVPVYFEPRLIKVALAEGVTEEALDQAADELTLGLDDAERDRIEKSVAVVNAVYGAPARLNALAEDLMAHWKNRRRQMRQFIGASGKGLIVAATREIAANLYDAIVALEPDWHHDAIDKGKIKVVYSGAPSDPQPIVRHVRRESQNKVIKERLKNVDDELELVIVKDMMLTGYDSPPLHTLYLDRPLQGALLMQTLARVNRTYRGKQDGLLVAYAPLADNLQKALAEYTATDRERKPMGRTIDEAVALTQQLVEQLRALLAGYDWKAQLKGGRRDWITAAVGATNYVRDVANNQARDDEESLAARYRRLSGQLSRAWAIASGAQTLQQLRPEIRFYEEVRVWMAKMDAEARKASGEPLPEEIQRLLAELLATSTETGGIVDIYQAAGIPKPSLMDLGPDFVQQAKRARNPQLAVEALRAMLTAESARATVGNLVRQRAFSERITDLMTRYTNQQLTSAEVIAELVALAKDVAAEANRGQRFKPPLNSDELAFYDAVAANESAVQVQGEGVLAQIARDLVAVMRRDVRTDWTVRDDVRAKLRTSIKRLLVRHGYPPDKQPGAIKLVMEQMEAMAPRYTTIRSPG